MHPKKSLINLCVYFALLASLAVYFLTAKYRKEGNAKEFSITLCVDFALFVIFVVYFTAKYRKEGNAK